MRQVMPNTGWRIVDNNVPDYIPVEFERYAAPVAEPNGIIERVTQEGTTYTFNEHYITSTTPGTSTYTVLDGAINVGSTLTTTSSNTTMMEMSMDDVHEARRRMEALHMQGPMEESVEETIDDSELEEPEPITKRKIVRRKKEKPMFWKEEASGERTTLPALIGQFCSNLQQEGSIPDRGRPNPSSVYVKMIPLKVLNNSFDTNHRSWTVYSSDARRRNYQRHLEASSVEPAMLIAEQNTGISQLVNSMIINGRVSCLTRDSFSMHTANALNWFIKDRNLLDMAYVDNSASSFEYTSRAFINGESFRINARTFSVSLGQLTCFLETERYSRNFTPQVLAVILPENYIYQKEYVLLHGTIDLSKVVVLVNRELDDTSFPNKNFRAYYRKHILPLLNRLKVDVWKVPVSFMEENCFHQEVTLEKTSFMEKKQELENIYGTFRDQYSHIDLDPHPDNNGDSDDDDFDEDYDDEDDDY